MWTSPLAERWQHLLGNIPDLKLRADVLRAELLQRDPHLLAEGLHEIFLTHARDGEVARHVIVSLVCALSPKEADPARSRLWPVVARREDMGLLATWLGLSPDAREIGQPEPEADAAAHFISGADRTRPLTLGERKSLARTSDRRLLDRAARDPHPAVITILLGNPKLTEDRVVRIAARRPTTNEAQRIIAGNARWCARTRVQLALAQNPYTPSFLASPLTTLLPQEDLASILATPATPQAVQETARVLIALRQQSD